MSRLGISSTICLLSLISLSVGEGICGISNLKLTEEIVDCMFEFSAEKNGDFTYESFAKDFCEEYEIAPPIHPATMFRWFRRLVQNRRVFSKLERVNLSMRTAVLILHPTLPCQREWVECRFRQQVAHIPTWRDIIIGLIHSQLIA